MVLEKQVALVRLTQVRKHQIEHSNPCSELLLKSFMTASQVVRQAPKWPKLSHKQLETFDHTRQMMWVFRTATMYCHWCNQATADVHGPEPFDNFDWGPYCCGGLQGEMKVSLFSSMHNSPNIIQDAHTKLIRAMSPAEGDHTRTGSGAVCQFSLQDMGLRVRQFAQFMQIRHAESTTGLNWVKVFANPPVKAG